MVARNKTKIKGNNLRNIFFSVAIALFLIAGISFLIISNLRINQKRQDLIQRIEELKKEVQALEEKNQTLKAGLLQTGSESYWEEKLREQGYKKPGEEAVVVLPPEKKTEETASKEKNFWEKLLEKLGF